MRSSDVCSSYTSQQLTGSVFAHWSLSFINRFRGPNRLSPKTCLQRWPRSLGAKLIRQNEQNPRTSRGHSMRPTHLPMIFIWNDGWYKNLKLISHERDDPLRNRPFFLFLNPHGLRSHTDYAQQDRNQKERSVDIDVASPKQVELWHNLPWEVQIVVHPIPLKSWQARCWRTEPCRF